MKNFENQIWSEFVKFQEFTLVIILAIFPQNDNFSLQMKILKFLGIQPTHKIENFSFFGGFESLKVAL